MTSAPLGMKIIQLDIDCPAIINLFEERDEWKSSTIEDVIEDEARTSDTMFIGFASYDNPAPIDDMNRQVYRALDDYAAEWKTDFSEVEPPSVQRYQPGQLYSAHEDDGPLTHRVISAVLYLNSVTGGETHFVNFDYSVKPKPGRLAIFPSNYIYRHEARPPKRGTKYAVAYWAMP